MGRIREFFSNCRSAHIFRYASAYVVLAWGSVTVADTLGDNLNVPPTLEVSLVILWIALFPAFMAFVWVKNKALVADLPAAPPKAIDFLLMVALGLVLVASVVHLSGSEEESPAAATMGPPERPAGQISIGSKTFLESSLVLELLALTIQDDHPALLIRRKHFIGETPYVLDELERRNIDLYGDYTGTILAKYLTLDRHYQLDESWHEPDRLNQRLESDPALEQVRVLDLFGYESNYTLVMLRDTAIELMGPKEKFTLSDLARASKERTVRLGCTYGFANRSDGLRGLVDFYGFELDEVVQLLHDEKYSALDKERVEVVEGYTTDGRLAEDGFVAFEDDKGFWPRYKALPVVRSGFAEANPEIVASIERLAGQLRESDIRWCLRELGQRGYSSAELGAGNFAPLREVAREMLRKRGIID